MTIKQVHDIFTIAEEYMRNGNLTEAELLCQEMINGLQGDSIDTEDQRERFELKMSVENFFGALSWRQGKYSTSLEHFDVALAMSDAVNDKTRYARTLANMATVHMELGNFTVSLELYERAIAIHRRTGNLLSIATALGNMGNVCYFLSDYARAVEVFSQALDINEQLDMKEQVIGNTCNIANVYLGLKDYDRALNFYKKALKLSQQEHHLQFEAHITANLGVICGDISEISESLELHKKALHLHTQIDDTSGMAGDIANIGLMYQKSGDYQRAHEYFLQALRLNEELGNKAGIAQRKANIGSLYREKKFDGYDLQKAEEYIIEALAMFESLEMKQRLYECHLSLADLYEMSERWKEHAYHYKKYHHIEKDVLSEEAKKQGDKFFYEKKLAEEAARLEATDAILNNILPPTIAVRIKNKETTIADKQDNVCIFFSDIVGFTKLSQEIEAESLVRTLNKIFSEFDILARKHSIEKIKTIGDAYMAVCGVPEPNENSVINMAHFAIEVRNTIVYISRELGMHIEVRIGLHYGSVIAGVIGENKFAYDLWGDAVNTASRMESHGEPGKIHCTEEFVRALSLSSFQSFKFIERGEMDIKGKGTMKTYFLEKEEHQL